MCPVRAFFLSVHNVGAARSYLMFDQSGTLDEEDDLVSLVSLAEADTSSNCPLCPQASTNDVGSDDLAHM